MPVRNIRGIGGTKPIPVEVYIPPTFSPIYKIEVVTNSRTYDITTPLIEGEYTDGITETIGSFNLNIDNSSGTYTNLFNIYDTINIYMDYGASATTKVFTGKIERISKSDNKLVLTGKSIAVRTMGKNVTYSTTNTPRSDVLIEIINKYFDYINTTNIETDNTLITVNYEEKPFWEVVEEICNSAGYDAYIDHNLNFHYFPSGSRKNTTEVVVHDTNLIRTGDFSPDLQLVYNKIRVYGKDFNGLPLFATSRDSTSQSNYDSKELIIHDGSIDTIEQAQARADYELSVNKDPPIVGTILSLGLPTIKPGEKIFISDPQNGLAPNYYLIQKFTHKFSNDEPLQTELTIQKDRQTLAKILSKRIKYEYGANKLDNPKEMDYTYLIKFDTDTGSHTNTAIDTNSGRLYVSSGSTGTWISDNYEVGANISEIEVRINGSNLAGSYLMISLTGGEPYSNVTFGKSTVTSGSSIRFKVVLNNANAEVTGIAAYYKTT